MAGQPMKKLEEVEEFADRAFTTALNACCVIPRHYMDRTRRPDPRDQIGKAYRGIYEWGLMLHIVSERLENLLREKAGLEPRQSRMDEVRDDDPTAEPEDLEQQLKRESERLKGGDITVLD